MDRPETLTPDHGRYNTCIACERTGYHVDTTAGEIIENGRVTAVAPAGAVLLLAGKEDGTDTENLYCEDCAKPWTPPNRQRYPVAENPAGVDWAVIPQRSGIGPHGRNYIACDDDYESETFAVVHDVNSRTGLFRNWVVIHDAPSRDQAADWAADNGYDHDNSLRLETVVSMPR